MTRLLLFVVLCVSCATCGGNGGPTSPGGSPSSPALASPPIAGEYRLTITASPSCSLPAELEQRTYTARVSEPSAFVSVVLSGAKFVPGFESFSGRRNGDVLNLDLTIGPYNGVVELIGTTSLEYQGIANATIADGTIAGRFSGQFAVYDHLYRGIDDVAALQCYAQDHRIEFVRR